MIADKIAPFASSMPDDMDKRLHENPILIIDFGSQVTQLIARCLRESGVYCEIWPFTVSTSKIRCFAPKGVILSGSSHSVNDADAPKIPDIVFELAIPVLGICYGQQAMCKQLGGVVEAHDHCEYGRAMVDLVVDCGLFRGAWSRGHREQVWMSHGDRVVSLPKGFERVGTTEGSPYAIIADESRRLYGVQFHPEVVHTPHGRELLRNFTHHIVGCQGNWTMAGFRDMAIQKIRQQVGPGRVICGLSGGVDSAVTAALLYEAIGNQLTCIFVDHGMLRTHEAEQVIDTFRDRFNLHLVHRNVADLFLASLKNVTDAEEKRKIIGNLFVKIFEQEAEKLEGAEFLAQGTLYPDVIESVSMVGDDSVVIKSHHNVGGLPKRMNMQLVEPLRELFKDEVRDLGRELRLPEKMVGRHPFPGPGLAIRILGAVDKEKLDLLRRVDTIFLEEIRIMGLYDAIWQAFAILLPVKTVGVMGDGRSYDYACVLRAVTSTDGMTADIFPFDMSFLARVSNRIVNEVRGVNRVTYDITSKPPGTIEWE